MARAVRILAAVSLSLFLACSGEPQGGSFTCVRNIDGQSRCYTCPSQSAASTCSTDGPSAGGCSTTPVSCP